MPLGTFERRPAAAGRAAHSVATRSRCRPVAFLVVVLAVALLSAPAPAAAKACRKLCAPAIAACRMGCVDGSLRDRRRCKRNCRSGLLATCRGMAENACTSPSSPGSGAGRHIVVNGAPLDAAGLALVAQLETRANARVPDGRYWYDAISGLWGREGQPPAGQIDPGLALGGPLAAAASGGTSGVFVNGRELHPAEIAVLSRCVTVPPGRYWVDARGVGGVEGDPPTVDLAALCRPIIGNRGGDTWYGSVIGGDGIVGGLFGATGVTCGPDGGCIF